MLDLGFVIFFVGNVSASAAFYAQLLGRPPIEISPTFALFAMPSGTMLGLWARDRVEPPASAVGGSEIAFRVTDAAAVDALHAEWGRHGVTIAQAPIAMDFGHTFVALDPDGHRLRVFAPSAR